MESSNSSKSDETKVMLFLTIVLFPVATIILIGAYGFVVWFLQFIFGPPGS